MNGYRTKVFEHESQTNTQEEYQDQDGNNRLEKTPCRREINGES
jgi:hypothetical protein